jgi:AraC-like DNA-binding protein/ligand-binding sensor protein
MNANLQLIESLRNSPIFREYERAYTETTGLPVALRPVETWQLPFRGRRGESPFCALMAEKSATCAACLRQQDELARAALAGEGPSTSTCAFGLTETAVPVRLGEEPIGLLVTGQVLRQKPTAKAFARAMAQVRELGLAVDEGRAEAAFYQTQVVSTKRLESAGALLGIFAEHLALKSNQIAVQEAHREPPVITSARRYVQEHFGEELSLTRVSSAVHTSLFYFCKLFRRVTGLTFTEYVSRTRVEKAKNLLLNPHLRVSEIAYAAGFQSLTHFNRVFKKVVGESPTGYRHRLPKPT